MTTFYTEAEIKEHGLTIPTEEEVEKLLDSLDYNSPMCGSLSMSQVNPNAFCVCSRNGAGTSTGACDLC